MPTKSRLKIYSRVILSLVVVAIFSVAYYSFTGPSKVEKTVLIERGLSVYEIAKELDKNGVINHPEIFTAIAIITRQNKKLKAGEYDFPAGITPSQVLRKLIKGDVIIHSVTIPEGFTNYQALEVINKHPVLAGDITVPFKEGELFPDTYYFSRGYTKNELISRMKSEQEKVLFELWQKRKEGLPLKSPKEALVLASIVEKETGIEDERARVAGVFINRLKRGMPLQSDPTALYAVSNKTGVLDRLLTKKDLEIDSPYNTYAVKGLPPGPIANPGRKAIEATLNPADTKDLYFVATGNGGHNFSETLEGHLANVKEYKKALKSKN